MENFLKTTLFPTPSIDEISDLSSSKVMENYFSIHLSQIISSREVWEKEFYHSNLSAVIDIEFAENNNRRKASDKGTISNYQWEDFVNNMSDGFQITEPESQQILFINPAGAEIYGSYDPKVIIGSKLDSLIGIKNYEKFSRQIALISQSHNIPTTVHQIVGIDGIERFVELDWKPIEIEGQIFVQTILRDITKREKIRQKIIKSAREREVLLQEIHHRVKNNLAIISGIITLHELENKSVTNETLRELQSRIQTLASIQEVIYESRDFSVVDIIDCVNKLKKNTSLSSISAIGRIKLNSHEMVYLNINKAMSLLQLLVELLMPYSADDNTNKIELSFSEKDGQIKADLLMEGSTILAEKLQSDHKDISTVLVDAHLRQLNASLGIEQKSQVISICFDPHLDKRGSGSSLSLNQLK